MLFMLVVKASKNSEANQLPSPELMEAMTRYNEELMKAGVRVMAKGLHSSSNGIRISFPKQGEKPIVTVGPFTATQELIAGFILIEVNSREEAIEWRCECLIHKDTGKGRSNYAKYFKRPIG